MKNKKVYIIIILIVLGLFIIVFNFFMESKTNKNVKKIGIIQIVEHECLDNARNGFIEGLKKLGFEDGKNIKIDYQNAGGDSSILNAIANNFVNDKKDIILAISTPAAQAISSVTSDIPIFITAVTDPISSGLTAKNITGTSDLIPVEKQIKLIKKLLPNSKKIAILYCSSESNSKTQAEIAAQEAKKYNLETKDYTVSNSNEIQQIVEHIDDSTDAIFVPTDNLIVSCMSLVSKIALSRKIPIISSEVASIKNGATAAYGMNYYELGNLTAIQAVKILDNPKYKISDIPIEHLKETRLTLNYDNIKELNIPITEELKGELK